MLRLALHLRCGITAAVLLAAMLLACQPRTRAPAPVESDAAVAVRRVTPCVPGDPIETCRKACTAGLDDGCQQLGLALVEGGRHDEATPHLVDACEAGSGAACGGLGQIDAARGEPAAARTRYRAGCEAGDGPSCEGLGTMLMADQDASNGRPDAAEITGHLKRGCELGAASSCNRLADAIVDGDLPGKLAEALRYYFQACTRAAPVVSACSAAAELLGAETRAGRRLRRRFNADRMATDLLTRGCDLGDPGCCRRLADMARR